MPKESQRESVFSGVRNNRTRTWRVLSEFVMVPGGGTTFMSHQIAPRRTQNLFLHGHVIAVGTELQAAYPPITICVGKLKQSRSELHGVSVRAFVK